jgi:Tfp pilus assembly protein PilF
MGKKIYPLLLIVLIGLIAYSNTFDVPFNFDDLEQIKKNPQIQSLNNFASSLKDNGFSLNRRFIGYLTFALNYHFGGLNVAGYHAVNLTIHITNAILVYFLVILTFKTPYFTPKRQAIAGKGKKKNRKKDPISNPVRPTKAQKQDYDVQPAIPEKKVALIAMFSALLFVSHPIQTQAVTYIVQRFTSLTAFFYLLSLVFYIKAGLAGQWGRGKEDSPGAKGKMHANLPLTMTYYILSLISTVLAMHTKEISFTLPIVIICYEFFFFKTPWKKKLLFLLPIILTLSIIPLSIMDSEKPLGDILSDLSEKTRVQTKISRGDYLLTQIRVITTYIGLLFFPVNQNLDYDYPIYHSFFSPSIFFSFLFLLALFGSAIFLFYLSRMQIITQESLRTHTPLPLAHCLISFGILWFFIALSIESSIIPIADVIFEHRVYLPSVGAFIAITTSIFFLTDKFKSKWEKIERVVIPAFFVIILILSGATFARNMVWQDEVTLWEDVIKKSPEKSRGYNDLGYFTLEKGLIDKAIGYFQVALRLRYNNADAHNNLAVASYNKGWIDRAIIHFQIALRLSKLKADIASAHHNLGIAYSQKGMLDDALRELEAALKIDPNNPEIYNDIGVTYKKKGFIDKAIKYYLDALNLNADYAMAHLNLGGAYVLKGLNDKAKEHFTKARRLNTKKY